MTAEGGLVPGILDSVLDSAGLISDPVRVIRLDRAIDAHAAESAASSGHLLVGLLIDEPTDPRWRELAAELDVTYADERLDNLPETVVPLRDPRGGCDGTVSAIKSNPYATHVLSSELTATSGLPVRAALDVESFAYSTLLRGAEFGRWLATREQRTTVPESADPVLVERAGDALSIVLNRPERRNAYGAALRDALCAALDIAVADPDIGHVRISGAGPSFCAGGDLDEFGTAPDPAVAHTIRTIAGAGRRLAVLRDRTTVWVHGACIGAGIEMPAFAGTVVADPGAHFRLPEVAMGLIPGAGGTVSIPRRIGRWRTFHLAVTGTTLDTDTALSWGLVDRVETFR